MYKPYVTMQPARCGANQATHGIILSWNFALSAENVEVLVQNVARMAEEDILHFTLT
jgi:hypothetical protein